VNNDSAIDETIKKAFNDFFYVKFDGTWKNWFWKNNFNQYNVQF